MRKALIAGVVYFGAVFSLGFLMGVLRVLVMAPRVGETGAVLLELPVMLAASWLACGRLVRVFGIGAGTADRAVMGASALFLLLVAETAAALVLFGRTPDEWLGSWRTTPALLGLASQVAFGLFPLFRRPS